jgi:hypothetical protein
MKSFREILEGKRDPVEAGDIVKIKGEKGTHEVVRVDKLTAMVHVNGSDEEHLLKHLTVVNK